MTVASTPAQLAAKSRYREKNREQIRARERERMRQKRLDPAVKAADAEKARSWRAANPGRAREVQRRHYKRNAETMCARSTAYHFEHRDERLAWLRAYYQRNRAEALAYARAYRQENLEAARAATSRWLAANPEKRKAYGSAYRARKANAEGAYTAAEFAWLCRLLADVCFYCGEAKPLTADHAIPLSRGGPNFIDNIVPACKPCNSSKRDATMTEYLERRCLK